MQYVYIGMAIRSAINTINVACCILINTVNLNIIEVIKQSVKSIHNVINSQSNKINS